MYNIVMTSLTPSSNVNKAGSEMLFRLTQIWGLSEGWQILKRVLVFSQRVEIKIKLQKKLTKGTTRRRVDDKQLHAFI
ncbi:hypothetical protein Csa_020670 [Cucumis sativus]|uniref:Uncharacterized protein n=1 Tax=Cucumis sativus TaxID=3659 RepID=A0A0A0KHA0_CUCSA|nr:hypothetical protein Csa_020670 [Cucumis sativus]